MRGFLRLGPGVSVTRIGDAAVLFNTEDQRLYRLSARMAEVWRRASSNPGGVECEELLDLLAQSQECGGARPDELVEDWVGSGVLQIDASRRDVLVLGVAGRNWSIDGPAAVVRDLRATFFDLLTETTDPPADGIISVDPSGSEFALSRDGGRSERYGPRQIVPAIKALLTTILLESDYLLALHAASLRTERGLLLLSGPPGAGKTTLALALAAGGAYRLAGDDVILLDAAGRASGIPFPAAVKKGSWDLLRPLYPGLRARQVHLRPDGQTLIYLPCNSRPAPPMPVSHLLFLQRGLQAKPALRSVPALAAFERLLGGAASPGHRLTAPAFRGLVSLVNTAAAYELEYNHLADAANLIRRLLPAAQRA